MVGDRFLDPLSPTHFLRRFLDAQGALEVGPIEPSLDFIRDKNLVGFDPSVIFPCHGVMRFPFSCEQAFRLVVLRLLIGFQFDEILLFGFANRLTDRFLQKHGVTGNDEEFRHSLEYGREPFFRDGGFVSFFIDDRGMNAFEGTRGDESENMNGLSIFSDVGGSGCFAVDGQLSAHG